MILKVNGLKKEVTSGESLLTILDNVSFELQEGQSLAITGPSGSGKSTLLGLLAGLDIATSGEIYLDGIGLHLLDEERRAGIRKEKIGFVFQSFELLPSLTALENVMLPSELKSETKPMENAEYFLERVGLKDRQHHYPNQLSGGEQQRVAVARALINNPKVIFADEPTGNLDNKTSDLLHKLFLDLRDKHNITFVIVTHNKELSNMADRKLNLVNGKWA